MDRKQEGGGWIESRREEGVNKEQEGGGLRRDVTEKVCHIIVAGGEFLAATALFGDPFPAGKQYLLAAIEESKQSHVGHHQRHHLQHVLRTCWCAKEAKSSPCMGRKSLHVCGAKGSPRVWGERLSVCCSHFSCHRHGLAWPLCTKLKLLLFTEHVCIVLASH